MSILIFHLIGIMLTENIVQFTGNTEQNLYETFCDEHAPGCKTYKTLVGTETQTE